MKLIDQAEKPPIGSSWQQLYLSVLVLHAFIIVGFYLLTRYFS